MFLPNWSGKDVDTSNSNISDYLRSQINLADAVPNTPMENEVAKHNELFDRMSRYSSKYQINNFY